MPDFWIGHNTCAVLAANTCYDRALLKLHLSLPNEEK